MCIRDRDNLLLPILDRKSIRVYCNTNLIRGDTMQSINKTMIEYAIKISHEVEADSLLVCVDVTKDIAALPEEIKKAIGVIIVTPEGQKLPGEVSKYVKRQDVHNINLTRVEKIKIAIANVIVLVYFKRGDKIICLSGVPKFG